jgi:DNA-binding response OmpR family regulator
VVPPTEPIKIDKPKLLLVSDELKLSKQQKSDLCDACYDVTLIHNTIDCLKFVTNKPVDHFSIIILKAKMPLLDGYTICERIRAH